MCKRGSDIREVLSSEREENELRQLFSQTERERERQGWDCGVFICNLICNCFYDLSFLKFPKQPF